MPTDGEKIDQLAEKSSLQPSDILPIVDMNSNPAETKFVTVANLDVRYLAFAIALG